jgi:hypothetical protein
MVCCKSLPPLRKSKGGFRRIIETELGEEQYCASCDEFWPTDSEFFSVAGPRLSYVCRACTVERKNSTVQQREGSENSAVAAGVVLHS